MERRTVHPEEVVGREESVDEDAELCEKVKAILKELKTKYSLNYPIYDTCRCVRVSLSGRERKNFSEQPPRFQTQESTFRGLGNYILMICCSVTFPLKVQFLREQSSESTTIRNVAWVQPHYFVRNNRGKDGTELFKKLETEKLTEAG